MLPEVQLYHYKARVYDPSIGRFLEADPIGYKDDFNLYAYVGNDPLNAVDPWGLETYDCTSGSPTCPKQMMVSALKSGDVIKTDGAKVDVGDKGKSSVTFNKGFEDGASAAKEGPVIVPMRPRKTNVDTNMKTAEGKSATWFRDQVKNKGPWDYKQRGGKFEPFGNFNFGATGRANGFPGSILLQETGRAQTKTGTSLSSWGGPGIRGLPFTGSGSYGDDPVDQFWIQQGINYHNQN